MAKLILSGRPSELTLPPTSTKIPIADNHGDSERVVASFKVATVGGLTAQFSHDLDT